MAALVPVIAGVLAATTLGGIFVDTNPSPIDTPYLSAAIGKYDVLKNTPRDVAMDIRAEIDPNWIIYKRGIFTLKPFAAVEVTTDGALYGGAGFKFDTQYEHIYFTPSVMVGVYHDGGGKDLGHAIEFRSGIELGYEFDNQARLGVGLSHISNADIGDRNPGTEILSLYYHHPINF